MQNGKTNDWSSIKNGAKAAASARHFVQKKYLRSYMKRSALKTKRPVYPVWALRTALPGLCDIHREGGSVMAKRFQLLQETKLVWKVLLRRACGFMQDTRSHLRPRSPREARSDCRRSAVNLFRWRMRSAGSRQHSAHRLPDSKP